jgi:hypothetical protein
MQDLSPITSHLAIEIAISVLPKSYYDFPALIRLCFQLGEIGGAHQPGNLCTQAKTLDLAVASPERAT